MALPPELIDGLLGTQTALAETNDPSQLDNISIPTMGDCSWAEVFTSMEKATQTYKSMTQNDRLRATQRNKALAVSLRALADMIPDQDGLSILRGGLGAIFKMLEKRIDNGERILWAFEDIPMTFCNACNALRAYPNDEHLKQFFNGLYHTVKEEVPKLIDILLRKHKGSLCKRIFKQHPENEASSIDHSLELIDRASKRETRNIGVEMTKSRDEVSKICQGLDSFRISQYELEQVNAARLERQDQLTQAFMQRISQDVQKSLESQRSYFRQGFFGIQESLRDLMWNESLHSTIYMDGMIREAIADRPYLASFTSPSQSLSIPISYDEIYMMLQLPNGLDLEHDLGIIIRASNNIKPEGMSRAAWILQVDRFKRWTCISNDHSNVILVDGHLGHLSQGKVSPLSVLAATFSSMSNNPRYVILTHFCGLHTNPRYPMSGCRGIFLSLIVQLIMDQRDKHDETVVWFDEDVLNAISHHELGALFQLFFALLTQVDPRVTVYCIIDNVSEFETQLQGWQDELCHVVNMLQQAASQLDGGPTFKVLLTAANRSIKVFRQVGVEDHISLSAGNTIPWSTKKLSLENGWNRAMSLE